MSKPTNLKLYNRVKAEAKAKFKTYPSIYANSWLVQEYKDRGGKYKEDGKESNGGLVQWYQEKWVDVKTGKPCGRSQGEKRDGYPACRPTVRVNAKTPKTVSELSAKEKAKFIEAKKGPAKIDFQMKRKKK